MVVSLRTRLLVVPPQVMALRRAVPKTPPRSPVPPRSPIHQPRLFPTPSESTLPQLLIPPHFKSFIRNAYKKPGEGPRPQPPKFSNSSLPTPSSCGPHTNARNPNPLYALLHDSLDTPGVPLTPFLYPSVVPPSCHSACPEPRRERSEESAFLCASERAVRGESVFPSTCVAPSPHPLPTHPDATPPERSIPPRPNSFISNTYKKKRGAPSAHHITSFFLPTSTFDARRPTVHRRHTSTQPPISIFLFRVSVWSTARRRLCRQ
jgi:hypothetical protein